MTKDSKISQQIFDIVCEHFGGDKDKTWKWFQTPNPALSYREPLKMIKSQLELPL